MFVCVTALGKTLKSSRFKQEKNLIFDNKNKKKNCNKIVRKAKEKFIQKLKFIGNRTNIFIIFSYNIE